MSDYKTKIVAIDDVIPGMVTSQDVFTDMGQMLIGANTTLDEKHLKKLRLYQINNVPIREALIDLNSKKSNISTIYKTPEDIQQFKSFESSHGDYSLSLKQQMLDISDGMHIDVSQLFSISNDLLDIVKHKSKLFSFLNSLQNFDDYTYSHCINVSLICHTIGQWLCFSHKELMDICVAGMLHDIGKIKVDKDILTKPGPLTEAEYEIMQKHTVYGFKIVEKQDIPYNIKMAILMHHERYDGSGYPLKAKNDEINDYAKIVAIADVYDALTSDRPYRSKFTPFHVIHRFEKEYLGKLDTKFLMIFLRNIAYCYLDSWCLLSTGEEAKIVFINKHIPSKPIVQVDNVILDLSQEPDIYIQKIL
ncbi:HD-GYP domain-containing protein [Paramaledivibacter caminithermalis]|uniref:HDIG domain-containing protein n=1 Tax=Paramaledivibacter caminithermalis (strain DSM 15212 / CIP 107654 / DViRD3) TaxID=1121301 RepID=A0A1M6KK29_PARC5|nr:HD-GYP domain-containing protein [Paramaledivibacter caminithermalis]SHJ59313.1 HDIG domain-containing protein [Paramaledivibacter caminithermalis DSM 15212]